MGEVIEVSADRFTEKPLRAPHRVTDEAARTPIGASLKDLAAAVHSAVRITGEPEQATVMRRQLRMIAGTRHQEFPTVELLASELFNNSIRHSRSGEVGGEITVVVIKMPNRIQVKVIDQGPRPGQETGPQVRPVDLRGALLSEGGFGLRLVEQEATRWGWSMNEPRPRCGSTLTVLTSGDPRGLEIRGRRPVSTDRR